MKNHEEHSSADKTLRPVSLRTRYDDYFPMALSVTTEQYEKARVFTVDCFARALLDALPAFDKFIVNYGAGNHLQ